MMWFVSDWFGLVLAVGNIAGCIFLVRTTRRAMTALKRTAQLEALLRHLCVQAFVLRHAPIWQAWTAAMGDIEVTVSTIPKKVSGNVSAE